MAFWGRWQDYLPLGLALIAVLHPLAYFNIFSGDAEIHLVYGHNFINGYPLQFNPGEPSSGQTSLGFLFVVIPAMKLVGEWFAPVAMKLVGLFSLYVIAIQTYRLGKLAGLGLRWSLAAAAATLLLPGSIFNGMLGSENAFFGALILSWTLFAIRWGWLSETPPTLGRDCVLGLLMGAIFWIRPETIPFGGIAWIIRSGLQITRQRRLEPSLIGHGLAFALCAAVFVAAYIVSFYGFTGMLPFGAGYARLLESIDVDSVWVGGLSINVKVLQRLAAYCSVTLPALYGLVTALRTADAPERRLLLFLGLEFFGLMLLYSLNLVTAFHFARYTIFAWPMAILVAAYGLSRLETARLNWPVAAAGLMFLAMAGYETLVRKDFAHDTLTGAMNMPKMRATESHDTLRSLGNPTQRPVVIATQEVQARNTLDNRFIIRSLDGITDISFLKYLCHGYNDHDGYFIDQHVDFLSAPFANYNHDRRRWSVKAIEGLRIGQTIERPGIRYTRISGSTAKITRLVTDSTARTIKPCEIDSRSPYF